jgi:lambda family phage holin
MHDEIKNLIDHLPHGVAITWVSASTLALLRVLGDKHPNRWQRLIIEPTTAGIIGVSTLLAATELGLGIYTAGFISCMIGHLGTDYIREAVRAYVERRINKG